MKSNIVVQQVLQNWRSPVYLMLVGVPGVGKSTFTRSLLENISEKIFIASTDNLLEVEAKKLGLTYSEAFNEINQKHLKTEMNKGEDLAVLKNSSIIHDQTNMSRKSRVSKLKLIPERYHKICLNFTCDDKILIERLDVRAKLTGKVIPSFVLKSMFNSYNPPSLSEGFNKIIEVETT